MLQRRDDLIVGILVNDQIEKALLHILAVVVRHFVSDPADRVGRIEFAQCGFDAG